MARFYHVDERSWVDLFTNNAFVNNPDKESLTNILLSQTFPKEIFFSFIHEATHHWCFDSIFGYGLFMIKSRSFLAALTYGDHNKNYSDENSGLNNLSNDQINLKYDIYSDYARFNAVELAFKPLIEGMALFAEFDTWPSTSQVCPSFLVYSTIMFSGIKRTDFKKTNFNQVENNYLNHLIERKFLSRSGIVKKARLLSTDIDIFKNPYLTGYLFVKTSQLILIQQDARFKDPNFFLTFLKDYYFEDKNLVELLISEKVFDEYIVPKVFDYFQTITAKLTTISGEQVDDFEKRYTKAYVANSYTDMPEPDLSSYPAIQKLVKQFDENCKKFDIKGLAFMRTFFCITKLPCYIKISSSKVKVFLKLKLEDILPDRLYELKKHPESFSDCEYFYYPALDFSNSESSLNYDGEAILEKYVSFSNVTKHFSVFVFKNESLLYDLKDSNITEEESSLIKQYFRRSIIKFKDLDFDSIIKKVWDVDDPLITTIEEFHRDNNFSTLNKMYQSRAYYCSEITFEKINEILGENGFYDLLKSTRLIEILSFFSLYSSNKCCPITFFDNNDIFKEFRHEEIVELNEILEKSGFYIFKFDDHSICTSGI